MLVIVIEDLLRTAWRAYVIKAAVSVWKKSAVIFKRPERYAPMRLQSANSPVKREQAMKKRAMSAKANMKRVR